MSLNKGFTRASAMGPIADFVDLQGGSISRISQSIDLPLTVLDSPDTPMPLSEQFKVLEHGIKEIADPYFGASLGSLVRIENLSSFGIWVSNAATVGQAIARGHYGLNKYLQTGTRLQLTIENQWATWSIEFLDRGFEGRFQNELLGVSYLIDCIRCFLGRDWTPDLIRLTGTKSSQKHPTSSIRQARQLETIFAAPVMMGFPVSSIEFPADLLDRPKQTLARFLPDEVNLFHEQPMPTSHDPQSMINAVAILASLEAYPRIDWVADKLGLTRRTLQRRLAAQGISFSELIESIIFERAKKMLAEQTGSVTEISIQLGYSDPAHFSRAFKRWSGLSPRQYRQNNVSKFNGIRTSD